MKKIDTKMECEKRPMGLQIVSHHKRESSVAVRKRFAIKHIFLFVHLKRVQSRRQQPKIMFFFISFRCPLTKMICFICALLASSIQKTNKHDI